MGDRDVRISFVTHSDLREAVTALVAAAVLCELADGIVYDPQDGRIVLAADAVTDARESLGSARAGPG